MKDICIVGGGPAGAYLAYLLAKSGIDVTVFDHSHPREKPCGGGVSPQAIKKFPVVKDVPQSAREVTDIELISPKGREVFIDKSGEFPSINVSRMHLDSYLLNKAIDNGAELIEKRVKKVEKNGREWIIKTDESEYKSEILVGADGTNSIVRGAVSQPTGRKNISLGLIYIIEETRLEHNIIKFLNRMSGYLWAFPREKQVSVGIGSSKYGNVSLKPILDEFMKSNFPDSKVVKHDGLILPTIRDTSFYKKPCAGKDWVLIGDAAGHVDPITGEGIFYALWSADAAFRAIKEGRTKLFDEIWREEYGVDLFFASRILNIFYNPISLEFLILMASRSESILDIVYNIITSRQRYSKLPRKIVASSPRLLLESLKGCKY